MHNLTQSHLSIFYAKKLFSTRPNKNFICNIVGYIEQGSLLLNKRMNFVEDKTSENVAPNYSWRKWSAGSTLASMVGLISEDLQRKYDENIIHEREVRSSAFILKSIRNI